MSDGPTSNLSEELDNITITDGRPNATQSNTTEVQDKSVNADKNSVRGNVDKDRKYEKTHRANARKHYNTADKSTHYRENSGYHHRNHSNRYDSRHQHHNSAENYKHHQPRHKTNYEPSQHANASEQTENSVPNTEKQNPLNSSQSRGRQARPYVRPRVDNSAANTESDSPRAQNGNNIDTLITDGKPANSNHHRRPNRPYWSAYHHRGTRHQGHTGNEDKSEKIVKDPTVENNDENKKRPDQTKHHCNTPDLATDQHRPDTTESSTCRLSTDHMRNGETIKTNPNESNICKDGSRTEFIIAESKESSQHSYPSPSHDGRTGHIRGAHRGRGRGTYRGHRGARQGGYQGTEHRGHRTGYHNQRGTGRGWRDGFEGTGGHRGDIHDKQGRAVHNERKEGSSMENSSQNTPDRMTCNDKD